MQSEHYPVPREVCLSQRNKDQVGMDAQIAHRLLAEKQAKGQCQNF